MSGGSYDYLCYAPFSGSLSRRTDDIERMAARLERSGHRGAARATRDVLRLIEGAERAADALSGVWRAVEWADSGDWCEDDVAAAVAKFIPRAPAADDAKEAGDGQR